MSFSPARVPSLALLTTLLAVAPAPGAAQEMVNAPGQVTGAMGRHLDATGRVGNWNVGAAEWGELLPTLVAFENVIRAHPDLRAPRGVEVVVQGDVVGCSGDGAAHGAPVSCETGPVALWGEIGFFALLDDGSGRPVRGNETGTWIYFYSNAPAAIFDNRSLSYANLVGPGGYAIYKQPRKIRSLGGVDLYDNDVLVFKRNPRPLWIPVSREEYIQALVYRHASEPWIVEEMRRELSAMPVGQRSTQAHIDSYYAETASMLVPADTPEAWPLVRFNPAYFDPALPRTTPQLVVLRYSFSGGPAVAQRDEISHADAVLLRVRETLDYARVAAIVGDR